MPRMPKPPGMTTPSTSSRAWVGLGLGRAVVGLDPAHLDPAAVGEPARAQRLGHRQVGVGQVDVLADQGDGHLVLGVVDAVEQVAPHRPVDVVERQPEPADHVGVQALAVQHLRDVVDRRRVRAGHHGLGVDVAHQRDLVLQAGRDRPVAAADERVRRDADAAQRGHGVLGRLGLQLPGRGQVGHQRHVQEEAVLAADVVADLAGGLEERQRFDVADGAADLGDDHVGTHAVGVRLGHDPDARLDLVGDVRDDLHGVAQVLAAPLLGDHGRVHLAGGDVGAADQVGVEEALVVADVEVGLGAVLGDEHLAVLERVHRARVDVEVGVELLHGDVQPAGLEQAAEAAGRQSLAEGRGHPAGDEDVLGDAGLGPCR